MTDAGRAAVAQAAVHANAFSKEAANWDRAGQFPLGHVTAMQVSGLAAVTAPVSVGGGGVDQLRDLMAITATIAHGDSSMGIALSMHLSFCWSLSRARLALPEITAAVEALLTDVAQGRIWFCSGVTEAGTNFFHPRTTLVKVGSFWSVAGHKVFATGSPAATHLNVGARLGDRLATIVVPANTLGVEICDDWDGMGMRGSGSGQIWLREVQLDEHSIVIPGGVWGQFSAAAVQGRAWGNLGNLAAMLGIAEASREDALRRVQTQGRVSEAPLSARPTVRHHLAELDVDLAVARAVVARIGDYGDELAARPTQDLGQALQFMVAFQEAKLALNRSATAVVDRALDLSGGGGYRDSHGQSRRYRDVRAGGFMQPFSPQEALGFIGDVAVGVAPDPEG